MEPDVPSQPPAVAIPRGPSPTSADSVGGIRSGRSGGVLRTDEALSWTVDPLILITIGLAQFDSHGRSGPVKCRREQSSVAGGSAPWPRAKPSPADEVVPTRSVGRYRTHLPRPC